MNTAVEPRISDSDHDDDDRKSHRVHKDDWHRGYVLGEEITALCGHRFIPKHDPNKYPRCERCEHLLGQMRNGGAN